MRLRLRSKWIQKVLRSTCFSGSTYCIGSLRTCTRYRSCRRHSICNRRRNNSLFGPDSICSTCSLRTCIRRRFYRRHSICNRRRSNNLSWRNSSRLVRPVQPECGRDSNFPNFSWRSVVLWRERRYSDRSRFGEPTPAPRATGESTTEIDFWTWNHPFVKSGIFTNC